WHKAESLADATTSTIGGGIRDLPCASYPNQTAARFDEGAPFCSGGLQQDICQPSWRIEHHEVTRSVVFEGFPRCVRLTFGQGFIKSGVLKPWQTDVGLFRHPVTSARELDRLEVCAQGLGG